MKDPQESYEANTSPSAEDAHHSKENRNNVPAGSSRRSFLGKVGMGGAAAVALAAIPLDLLIEGKQGEAEGSVVDYRSNRRANDSWNYRKSTAQNEKIDAGEQPDNGDWQRFTDFSGSWSKCLQHDYLGIPNYAAYQSLLHAFETGRSEDFESILVGNPNGSAITSTLNGPQGALAFDLEGLDSHAVVIPPAPSVASAQTAAEQVENYWAALMRDVLFTDYGSSTLAAQACADLNNMSYISGNQNNEFPYPVTPQNLFRGQSYPGDGNVMGPYLSQFFLQPAFMGVQPLSQQFRRFLSVGEGGSDFLTDASEYQNVQNGQVPSGTLAFDPTYRYLRMGRDIAAYTQRDVLSQEYFVACLILLSLRAPVNPGNPYGTPYGIGRADHGFVTFNSEFCNTDAIGTLMEMSTRALKAGWFHKWIVHLRNRPEEYGALVHANLTHQDPMPQAAVALHPDVFNTAALPIIHSRYGTYLLPQAFPEGSPTHPCYPTGHGSVGGACITALKFFYDGSQRIRPLLQAAGSDVMMPSENGLSLVPYTGADRDQLTINGELSKLGWNTTFAHGIHAGIHFRSSSLYSLVLGEQVALSVLQDRAKGYNEPFTIHITKFDGTTATISNQH